MNEKKEGYSNKVHLTQEMDDHHPVPKICLPRTKLVQNKLFPLVQRQSTRLWHMQRQREKPTDLISSSDGEPVNPENASRNGKR